MAYLDETGLQRVWNKVKALIPTRTSELTNDSGFLTQHQSLAAYRTSSNQDVIDSTKVSDAPIDGKEYVRKNGAWSESSSGGGVSPLVCYPIGSIYMSINETDPSLLFGGTWEQIQDTFLLASGSSYSAGTTGGSADAVIVSHDHDPSNGSDYGFLAYKQGGNVTRTKVSVTSGTRYAFLGKTGASSADGSDLVFAAMTNTTGESGTGKNLPPYLAVYMWKRTA